MTNPQYPPNSSVQSAPPAATPRVAAPAATPATTPGAAPPQKDRPTVPARQPRGGPRQTAAKQPRTGAALSQSQATEMQQAPAPNTDIIDQADTIAVVMDLPGCEPEDIQVQVHEQSLTVYADREENFDQRGRVFQRERPTYVQRTVWVPGDDLESAEAVFENGVLTITVPKTTEAAGGTIPIQTRSES